MLGCGGGELAVGPSGLPPLRIRNMVGQVKVLHLSRKRGRKGAGVEMRNRSDAAFAGQLRLVQLVHCLAERADDAHACDDDATLHVPSLPCPCPCPAKTSGS